MLGLGNSILSCGGSDSKNKFNEQKKSQYVLHRGVLDIRWTARTTSKVVLRRELLDIINIISTVEKEKKTIQKKIKKISKEHRYNTNIKQI